VSLGSVAYSPLMHNRPVRGKGISGPTYRVERKAYRGVQSTVEHMVRFITEGQTHPDVRNVAIAAVKDVYPHDYTSELAAIFYDACRRVRYVRDPANAEMLHQPHLSLRTGAGDCDDLAVLLGALVKSREPRKMNAVLGALAAAVGAPVQVVTAGFESKNGPHSHTFLRVWDSRKGSWIVLDPVAGPFTQEMVSRTTNYRAVDIGRKG